VKRHNKTRLCQVLGAVVIALLEVSSAKLWAQDIYIAGGPYYNRIGEYDLTTGSAVAGFTNISGGDPIGLDVSDGNL
jgi:hypothetical protein